MGKSEPGNICYKSIAIAAFMICAVLGTSGCSPEWLLWQTGEQVVSQDSNERQLLLEELERQAKIMVSSGDAEVSSGDAQEPVPWELPENGSLLNEWDSAYAYSNLSESEQIWYRDMAKAMGTMTDKVKLSEQGIKAGLDESRVDKIFQSVLNDHPELFYVEGYSYTKFTWGQKTVAIEFTGTYNLDWDTAVERRREIEQSVEELLAGAPKETDDYEKIKYVYETLIYETDYDLEASENQNIYSVFVGHASVCQGYAKAFQYLMNRMGVECALVQGKVLDTGEGHAWNLVRADGDYYYVDTTWGDISYQSTEEPVEDSLPEISYDYLCITTEQLERTHVLDEAEPMPECTAEADNYYVREDALFVNYDKEKLEELVERRLEQGSLCIALRCADEACYRIMYEALLDRREIFDYLAGTGINSFVYSNNDRQLTLTFFMVTSKR